jgi:23S rRNA (cytidine1920-2'-O)/16S rRNA (cytidine1409-2'-O)-methyltransferase
MDLSFISLKSVLPAVWPFLQGGGSLVALVKPQFEAGKAEVDRGRGIIRDDAVRERVLEEVRVFAVQELAGAKVFGEMECPVAGADGNREFLLGLAKPAGRK